CQQYSSWPQLTF
nr:immunoglobulin light chain junction region [Macaca mulatta]